MEHWRFQLMYSGKRYLKLLHEVTEAVSLECAGAIARPLYVCTTLKGNEYCMSMASMSSLFQQTEDRAEYKCSWCSKCTSSTPDSGSVPMRVLLLYALVYTHSSFLTPLRMKSIRLLVSAPPESWAWGCEAPVQKPATYMKSQNQ